MTAGNNPKFVKWRNWIDRIGQDTSAILSNRTIQTAYLEILRKNPEIQSPADFHQWTARNYGNYVVMALRRQLDIDNDVISLKRLLLELKDSPQLLTKEWYRTLYSNVGGAGPIPGTAFADADFEQNAGKLAYFDPKIAEEDIKKLDQLGVNIARYANKQIAHNTKAQVSLTFKEINDFIDEFEKIVKKYILLFTGAGYVSLLPVWQYDWEVIFTKVWIKKSQ